MSDHISPPHALKEAEESARPPKNSAVTEEILGMLRDIKSAVMPTGHIAQAIGGVARNLQALVNQGSRIEAQNTEIASMLGQLLAQPAASPAARAVPAEIAPAAAEIADDRDLDSQWGNPEIRKDPPRWTGQSYAGCRFSDASPEYLETLAGFLDWKAKKDDEQNAVDAKGNPKSKWARLDAARARGWRKRALESKGARRGPPAPRAPAEPVPGFDDGDQVPF